MKWHKCKDCKKLFTTWETKNKFVVKRVCEICFYEKRKRNAEIIKKRWGLGEIKHTNPNTLGLPSSLRLTEDELTTKFIQTSTYLAIGCQKGLAIAYSTTGRTIRKWAKKFFKTREIKRYRTKNTLEEPSFSKMINFWEDKKIKDSDILQFIEEFKLDKFNKNNPVNKAILCWNKQIDAMSEKIKEQQNIIHSAWSEKDSKGDGIEIAESFLSNSPSTMINSKGEKDEISSNI
jgi:hypothetical protein